MATCRFSRQLSPEADIAFYKPTPKNDSWHEATLAHLDAANCSVWLHCKACQHSTTMGAMEFSAQRDIPMDTPLLTICRPLVCSREKQGLAWPEPYSASCVNSLR